MIAYLVAPLLVLGSALEAKVPLPAAAAPAPVVDLQQPVHGLYTEAHAGLGYAVKDAPIPATANFPTLGGSPEMLGSSTWVDVAIGYEALDNVALQLSGGLHGVNGRRSDRVRGLALAYGGLGVRLGLPLATRLLVTLVPQVLLVRADSQADPAHIGLGGMLGLGIDYFVHVRHISVGIDLNGMLALDPTRILVGVAPHVRYTF